ncbi:MAG: L-rhamnose isomerase [Verrucomicrobia bacterium]|nr:L-rhamnose isomerase [Verrucomicrobiota bacterium]MBU4430135.1 L-rhamnose isomerase [Verrucomicrobiota bacterium]MCG2681042.1 L-rhamnose isomerase [Kiritimatiellia bacterium]
MKSEKSQEQAYALARDIYARHKVDTETAIKQLAAIPISLNCWQGDDVRGFEPPQASALGGILPTGQYPGRARNGTELRADLDQAFSLIPGRHRVNLHAIYAETGGRRVDRDALEPKHFAAWLDWAKSRHLGLDFNGTFFAHPKATPATLSSRDPAIRKFWVAHGIACRRIGAAMGKTLGTPCVTNVWIPDGSKDTPADRKTPRERLRHSLDDIFAELLNPAHNLDSIEGKLFGLGSESYVVGSHDFYLAYAAIHNKLLCLDTGHFHPTESVADKISAILGQVDQLMLHVSRGVRWDSDHVVTLTDEVKALAEEIVRGKYLKRIHIGLDFFDASINRVACWVIGARGMLKALLLALLEPTARLQELERTGDYTSRLALLEEIKTLPFGAVWNAYCRRQNVPAGAGWIEEMKAYEHQVLSRRREARGDKRK